MVKKLQIGFVTAETWVIARVERECDQGSYQATYNLYTSVSKRECYNLKLELRLYLDKDLRTG